MGTEALFPGRPQQCPKGHQLHILIVLTGFTDDFEKGIDIRLHDGGVHSESCSSANRYVLQSSHIRSAAPLLPS